MFDASAFCGHWPFRNTTAHTIPEICNQLLDAGICGAAISPMEAILHPEPMTANNLMLQEVNKWVSNSFVVYPVPIIDPTLPVYKDHIKKCMELTERKIIAFKVFPSYHSYDFDLPALHELAEMLTEQNIVMAVQMRMEDERSQHATSKVSSIAAKSIATFAKCHSCLPILACGASMSDLRVFSSASNIYAEMSFVESGHLLCDALNLIGGNRLLLGTHAPLLMPAVGASKCFSDMIDETVQQAICAGNFSQLFLEQQCKHQIGKSMGGQ